MAITQQQIDALIQFIDETEDPLSVTNVIVAAILLFLNNKIKGMEETVATAAALDDEITARQEGDATLQQNIDTLSSRINRLVGGNVTEAIESFNEVIAFLDGVNDDETLLGKLVELKNQVEEASNKADKDPNTGKLAYSQAPSVVLASMGQGYDDPQLQYAPHARDFYYSGGIIYYCRSNNTPASLGEPIQGLVYCNQSTDDLYRWTGSQWRLCGNNGIDSQTYEAIKTNVNSVAAKIDELIQDLAPLAYLSSNTHNQLGPLTWPDMQPMLISPVQGSTINIGTLASNETQKSTTVHIEGRNLTQQVRINVEGTGFSVSESTLTASQVNAGIDINVIYSDSSPGDGSTKTCSLTISSTEVSRSVTVTASKAAETPVEPPVTRTVSLVLTGLSMTQNGVSIASSSVSDGGTFEGTLIVNDSASYDLPDSVTVDGSHGTVSYNNNTGAISIPNITSDITITASAKAKQQSQTLRVVRGWALAEDKYLADRYLGSNTNDTNSNNDSLAIPGLTVSSADTHVWYRPRQPFRASDGWALNSHGVTAGANKNTSSQYSTTNIYVAPNTARRDLYQFGSGSTLDDKCSRVCYTDYIPVSQLSSNGTLNLLYYHGNLRDQRISNYSSDKKNIFVFGLVFYQKNGNTYTPIFAKSCQGADSSHDGASRTIDLKNEIICDKSGSTYTIKDNIYIRATFRLSSVPTKAEVSGGTSTDSDWVIDPNCYLKILVGATEHILFQPVENGERTYSFVSTLPEPYEQYDSTYAITPTDVTT